MKHSAVFIMVFITLAFSGSAFAQGKPDFSGTWTLDIAKSDIGQGYGVRLVYCYNYVTWHARFRLPSCIDPLLSGIV